jgi:hypothetical protein
LKVVEVPFSLMNLGDKALRQNTMLLEDILKRCTIYLPVELDTMLRIPLGREWRDHTHHNLTMTNTLLMPSTDLLQQDISTFLLRTLKFLPHLDIVVISLGSILLVHLISLMELDIRRSVIKLVMVDTTHRSLAYHLKAIRGIHATITNICILYLELSRPPLIAVSRVEKSRR